MSAHEIRARALQMPLHERAHLAKLLLESLDEDDDIERAWAEEVERRLDDLDSGRVKAIPAAEVFADLRAQLRK